MALDRCRSIHRLLVTVATVLVVVAGCGSDSDPDERSDQMGHDEASAEKSGTGEIRSDLEPLTKRFEALGAPETVTWMSGTLGDSRVPGPSMYWIDAIVTLAPGRVDALERQYAATETNRAPDVMEDLAGEVPSGPLLTSDRLDKAFSQDGFVARTYLDASSGRIVLVATGQ